VIETDWLGLPRVYYHEVTGAVGGSILEVVDPADADWDPEGLENYLAFGYSVFGRTPVRHVRFLGPAMRLRRTAGGVAVEQRADGVAACLERPLPEGALWERMRALVGERERSSDGTIVVPLSGGLDSRLLVSLVGERDRVHAYTYGVSERQERSCEVVHAREVCRRLGVAWEHVPVGGFHDPAYFDAWFRLFGPATHAHGMYHLEFFGAVRAREGGGAPVLMSGLVGDAWAGLSVGEIGGPGDLLRLGYTHGMHADARWMADPPARNEVRERYYEEHREALRDGRVRVIEAMRCKLVLLEYLLRVPASLGFRPWAPFLDRELACGMVSLPAERRRGRVWQREHLEREGLLVEGGGLRCSWGNTLNHQALDRVPLAPLDAGLLADAVRPEYVRRVNAGVAAGGPWRRVARGLRRWRLWSSGLRRLGLDGRLAAYCAYLTLWPLQELARQRAAGVRGAGRKGGGGAA
jgi:hypothetical protein